jgi:hypothetical protein
MLFTSEFNKLMHFIKRSLGCTQKVAYRMARQVISEGTDPRIMSASSVFASWSYDNARSVAGHCWGLGKAYDETGDKGRAIAFTRAARVMYSMIDQGSCDFADVITQKFINDSIADEIIDFYVAAHTSGFTPRTVALITEHGATTYAERVHRARWSY